jgi:hypothetical protein
VTADAPSLHIQVAFDASHEREGPPECGHYSDAVYVSFTAVPLALTISIPLCAPRTS